MTGDRDLCHFLAGIQELEMAVQSAWNKSKLTRGKQRPQGWEQHLQPLACQRSTEGLKNQDREANGFGWTFGAKASQLTSAAEDAEPVPVRFEWVDADCAIEPTDHAEFWIPKVFGRCFDSSTKAAQATHIFRGGSLEVKGEYDDPDWSFTRLLGIQGAEIEWHDYEHMVGDQDWCGFTLTHDGSSDEVVVYYSSRLD